jgi:hypothetical protein
MEREREQIRFFFVDEKIKFLMTENDRQRLESKQKAELEKRINQKTRNWSPIKYYMTKFSVEEKTHRINGFFLIFKSYTEHMSLIYLMANFAPEYAVLKQIFCEVSFFSSSFQKSMHISLFTCLLCQD